MYKYFVSTHQAHTTITRKKIGHPVRSAIHKLGSGELVLRLVTTREYSLLYVLLLPRERQQAGVCGRVLDVQTVRSYMSSRAINETEIRPAIPSVRYFRFCKVRSQIRGQVRKSCWQNPGSARPGCAVSHSQSKAAYRA
jgi:hypothetical protein